MLTQPEQTEDSPDYINIICAQISELISLKNSLSAHNDEEALLTKSLDLITDIASNSAAYIMKDANTHLSYSISHIITY